jgi:tRNA modification GTPase
VELVLDGLGLPVWVAAYRAPRSYTREDLVEITMTGSPPLVRLVVRSLMASGSGRAVEVRQAGPGEFTLRAFLNGRLDLSQAESVASFIGACGEAEARASLRGLRGELRSRLESLTAELIETMALLEAALDFPDEDLPQVAPERMSKRIEASYTRLVELQRSSSLRAAADGSLRVVLAGFPNAGKSSLLNALLGHDAAITTNLPGTTRDPVRGVTVTDGRIVEWVDVAGTLDARFEVFGGEREDQKPIWDTVRRLTRVELEAADRWIWVAEPGPRLAESLDHFGSLEAPAKVLVIQKIDLLSREERQRLESHAYRPALVSATERLGLDELVERVLDGGPGLSTGAAAPSFLVSAHQEVELRVGVEALSRARIQARSGVGYEYLTADLRDALDAIRSLTGGGTQEDVLDYVFSRFCIGK